MFWKLNRDQFPKHLFFIYDAVSKSQWLHLIWLARDVYRLEQGLEPWPRDAVAATFIQRDRIRRKKKIEEEYWSSE